MTTDPADLRIGDTERATAAAELGEHYAQGRLDADEHEERLDTIWRARTRRDLDPVFADLRPPQAYAVPWAPPAAATARGRRRRRVPVPLVALIAVLAGLAVLTHLPLIVLGLVAWLVLSRGHCGRRAAPHRSRWS